MAGFFVCLSRRCFRAAGNPGLMVRSAPALFCKLKVMLFSNDPEEQSPMSGRGLPRLSPDKVPAILPGGRVIAKAGPARFSKPDGHKGTARIRLRADLAIVAIG